jgi:predicted dinucleotide-binding enzyme
MVTMPQVFKRWLFMATVALAESLGFETVDVGPSRYAREIEGMLILWMNARLNGRDFDYHLRRTPE